MANYSGYTQGSSIIRLSENALVFKKEGSTDKTIIFDNECCKYFLIMGYDGHRLEIHPNSYLGKAITDFLINEEPEEPQCSEEYLY